MPSNTSLTLVEITSKFNATADAKDTAPAAINPIETGEGPEKMQSITPRANIAPPAIDIMYFNTFSTVATSKPTNAATEPISIPAPATIKPTPVAVLPSIIRMIPIATIAPPTAPIICVRMPITSPAISVSLTEAITAPTVDAPAIRKPIPHAILPWNKRIKPIATNAIPAMPIIVAKSWSICPTKLLS